MKIFSLKQISMKNRLSCFNGNGFKLSDRVEIKPTVRVSDCKICNQSIYKNNKIYVKNKI